MTATAEPTFGEGDATYRELVDAAFSAIGKASFEMVRVRFAGGPEATSAVAAYRDLLDAVRTHMEYLVPSTRQTASTPASSADPAAPLRASTALLAARARHSAAPADPTTLPASARLWRVAAAKLRAAHDLLDTHRDPDRGWRTPDAWLLDSAQPQAAAVNSLTGFLRVLANSGQALALRAREADRDIDCADLLNPAPLRLAAASLSHHMRAGFPVDALDELTPARVASRPRSTAPQPLGTAAHAMTALRQQAWEQARAPHVSIRSIGHYAQLAITVHQHAAVIASAAVSRCRQLALNDSAPGTLPRLLRSSRLSQAAAVAWREVYRMTTSLHSSTPPAARTYEQVLEVRADLESVTRVADSWRHVDDLFPDETTLRRVLSASAQIVRPLEEISAWQTAAIGRLAAGSGLFVAATLLNRDDVSEDPTLAAAKLARRSVPLPERQLQQLLQACATADHATWAAVKAHRSATGTARTSSRPQLFAMRALHRAAGQPSVGL